MQKFSVSGMTCASCSAHVEKAVRNVTGVKNVSVNLLTNSMTVESDENISDQNITSAICEAVSNAGYGATLSENNSTAKASKKNITHKNSLEDTETPAMLKRLVASCALLVPLMYVSMGHIMWQWPLPLPKAFHPSPASLALFQMIMATLVMIVNSKFFTSGFKSALHGSPNMDSLVALGSGSSFMYSTVILFVMLESLAGGHTEHAHHLLHDLYFESAAMILALITVGKTLESHSKGKTTSAIKSLLELSPETACVIRDGKEITINASEVLHGDIFIVKPGQKIPVDGIVLEGISAVNESALTGESIPVDKSKGSEVYSATINQNGALTCKATKVGEETSLNQIIKLVEEASSSKAPVAKLADKVSGVFVPVVIVIALVTGSVWLAIGKTFGFALARAVSVLVISCPCALGLATPVAIMVGSGLGAKNGILFKNATALEECGKTDIVVLDKTGTVTEGNPIVTDVVLQDDITEDELLATAASLEAKSEHPLSKAIMNYILQKNISVVEVHSFEALPGFGVKATVNGKTLLGGNAELLKKIISPELLHKGNTLSEEGKTPLYFACDEKSLGIIAVADVAKKDSKKAIEQMQNENIQVVMLTGDNEKTANAIAKTVSIKNVIANVLPDDKDKVVSKLQQQGKVTMVGDGINDAPALTRAEIGIAIGAGTDVALEAADVVLMKSSLMDVVGAIHLSKAVLKNIKQNLFWAFCYNVIGIPVAAGVLFPAFGIVLNPMIGSLAMSLSSFCVVTNALRLNLFNPYKKIHSAKNNLPLELIQNNQDTNNESTMEALMTKTISIEGMMCNNCKMHVENALLKVQGVSAVNASVENKNATVTLAEDVANDVLANAVTEAGYTVNGVQ